jgi:hypothetical protein
MAEKIVLETEIKTGNSGSSVKGLKTELRELTKQLGKLEQGSEAFNNAAKRAGQLKEQIRGVSDAIENADPEKKFAPFARTVQGLAGGFAAAQGAMALFGSESQELEKTLIKVQGAMALSQGLNSLLEFRNDFKDLAKIISGPVIKAFSGLRSAIIATGIGALVVLVGTLIAYWEEISKLINGVNSSEKELLKTQEKRAENAQKNLDVLNEQENILKLQGKSEKEILQLKIKAIDAAIKEREVVLGTQKAQVKAQVEAAERNKQILKGLIQFISLPLTAILQTVDQVGKFLGKDWESVESVFGNISEMMFDPEETKQKAEDSISESEKALAKLKNDYAGYQLQIIDIDKKAADEKAKAKKEADVKQKKIDDSNAAYAKEADKRMKALADEAWQKEIDAMMNHAQTKVSLSEEEANALLKTRKLTDEELAKMAFMSYSEQLDYLKKLAEADKKLDEEKAQAKLDSLKMTSAALTQFSELAGKETAAGKALGVAAATIDTYVAAGSAYAAAAKIDPIVLAPLAAAGAIAAGLARVKAILSVKVPGGGGGGGSAPSAPAVPQFNPAVAQQVQGGGDVQLGMKPQKVYVVESDIRGTMNKVDVIQSNATIG